MARTITPNTKSGLYARVRARVEKMFGEEGAKCVCAAWAHYVHEELVCMGHRPVIQAGTASWPRLKLPEEDDGVIATHFSYQWSPDEPPSFLAMLNDMLPEMHVWVALPDRNEVIDFTTGYLPEQCEFVSGMEWTAPNPPPFVWCKADRLPPHTVYQPHIDAIDCALAVIADMQGHGKL
jgi:hypothetical protein